MDSIFIWIYNRMSPRNLKDYITLDFSVRYTPQKSLGRRVI